MEFTIDRETFQEGIKKTLGIVERNSPTPILQNVLIRTMTDDSGIEILATNREIGIRTNYDASVITPGSLTIPARKLNELVRELQGETVHLAAKKNGTAVITCNKAVCKINGLAADEYPEMIMEDGCESFMISHSLLDYMLGSVLYAVSSESGRVNMEGVFLQKITKDGATIIRMAATDGHRLAITDIKRDETDLPLPENGIIIPKKGAIEIKKICDGTEGDVEISFAKGAIIINAGRATLRVNLIDANYPDIQRIIPAESADGILKITAVRDDLLHSLRRMAVCGSFGCVLDIHDSAIHLEASDPNVGEIKDEIVISTPDPVAARVVKYNVDYLIEAIEAVTDQAVALNISPEFGGCLVRGADNRNYFGIVMPLKG